MGKKKKTEQRFNVSESRALTTNPFVELARDAATLDVSEVATPVKGAVAASARRVNANRERRGGTRAIVRYQRKGRRGKEVTLIEKIALKDEAFRALCQELKQALGCGGHIEDDVIVMAGDQRIRLPELLKTYGVSRVDVS